MFIFIFSLYFLIGNCNSQQLKNIPTKQLQSVIKHSQFMTDWLKLVQCKYTPSQMFTLYDYTKIVYPIDSGFYLKQIVIPQEKSSFITINHEYDKIISIHGALNHILTVEQKGQHFYVCFYAVDADEHRIRIPWNFQDTELTVQSLYSENTLMLCCSTSDKLSHQIVFFDFQSRAIVARGFVEGTILDMSVGPNCSLSLFMPKHVIAYKNQPIIDKETIGRIYKQVQATVTVDADHHCWIEDQLLIWGKNKAYIIIKNKICEQFNTFHRLHNIVPLICGFVACDGCVVKVFKKKNIKYQFTCQFTDQYLMECKNMQISPQEDLFAYFQPVTTSLIISTSFSNQIQQAERNQSSTHSTRQLKIKQISHSKAFDYMVYSSSQAWFAAANGTQIQLMNSHNYEQFLSFQLKDNSENNFSTSEAKIRQLAIHPNRPILAIALKKTIKIYYVTFNEIKVIKQLNVSMCGHLVFNHSGSILTAVVAGRGGAKLYNFRINEFKFDFSLIETLTIGKRPISVLWDSFDTKLYCFISEGYFMWTLQSKFKDRKQVILNLKFQPTGVILDKQENPIFWGGQKLALVENQVITNQQMMKGVIIKQIYIQNDNYLIVLQDGRLGKAKSLDLQTCVSKSLSLNVKDKKFQVQFQEGIKLIMITEDLNLRFYEFGAVNPLFTDVVGIQKKKLYHIMKKHSQYQQQIKKIKEDFTNVVLEIKNTNLIQQQKIQKQYKVQLKDHVQRQKKVKQEKIKLEEMMEKNMEIKQKQSMHQIKQLERLYQRKIALTTNKLLTEKEIGFRDKLTAQNKLKLLEEKHYTNIQQIRKQFADHLRLNILDRNQAQKEINNLKKQYQTKLYQLEEQNQILLKGLQQKNQGSISNLKKIVNNWQNKYSQCISQKDNLEKQCRQEQVTSQILREKIGFLQTRKLQSERRCDNLSAQITKIERVLEERNKSLQFYERRIEDLEKSNEILKYRVLQVKEQNDPYEDQIQKLKINLTDLEQQYQNLLKHSHEQEQKIQIIKKQKIKLKEQTEITDQKYKKLIKRYEQVIDKIRQTTKSPIQQIRRQLLTIVEAYGKTQKSYSVLQKRNDSPLGQLNRIRDHLQVCLDEAQTTNKKNQEQRKIQIMKKNQENSQLITQINTLRKKIRIFQDQIKEKNLQISRLIRGDTPTPIGIKQQKNSTTEAQSKQFTKTKSRQTFYEKTMFRSGHYWNSKRLKTEEGSRRKKSSHSMMRDRNPNIPLNIHPQAEQIEQYKRIIEQKDIFIQKLIAKIQKS